MVIAHIRMKQRMHGIWYSYGIHFWVILDSIDHIDLFLDSILLTSWYHVTFDMISIRDEAIPHLDSAQGRPPRPASCKAILAVWPLFLSDRNDLSSYTMSIYGGFLRLGYPQIIHCRRIFPFTNHPYGEPPFSGTLHIQNLSSTTWTAAAISSNGGIQPWHKAR